MNNAPMNETEKTTYQMLKYLLGYQVYQSLSFREYTPNCFTCYGISLPGEGKEFRGNDRYWTVVDFEKKKMETFACMISGHNGTDFGEVSQEVSWDIFLPVIYEKLVPFARNHAERLAQKEEEQRTLERKRTAAFSRLAADLDKIEIPEL